MQRRMTKLGKNEEFFLRAQQCIPGGVNSPVRAFKKVGGTPRFIIKGQGPYMFDAEGKRYIDHVLSWGPLILGHCHPEVISAVKEQVNSGTSYGAPTELEILMAEEICNAIPSIEQVRFVNSGTEATMSAIRLARAYTKRKTIVKFEGCYHGHVDSLLAKAGSGAMTFSLPDSSGVPSEITAATAVLKYNDIAGFKSFMDKNGESVAAVIVEPVAGNMGVVLPEKGFLETLRQSTLENKALLIFDEVITGFRLCYGGFQDILGIRPDITCLGKIIGGGMPVGAFGASRDIMSMLAPSGPVYQAGTLSGNPVAMAAGLATLKVLKRENPYPELEKTMAEFSNEVLDIAKSAGLAFTINHIGSMAGLFFNKGPVKGLDTVMQSDTQAYADLFHYLLDQGIYIAPSPFEAFFISTAHVQDVMGKTIYAMKEYVMSQA